MERWSYQCEVGKKLTLNDDLGGKMAKFFEYQGKEIFKKSGIPIPEGCLETHLQWCLASREGDAHGRWC